MVLSKGDPWPHLIDAAVEGYGNGLVEVLTAQRVSAGALLGSCCLVYNTMWLPSYVEGHVTLASQSYKSST